MKQKRRSFLKESGKNAAGAALLFSSASSLHAKGASDRLAIGILGGSRGLYLGKEFLKDNVQLRYVCDPDAERLDRMKRDLKAERATGDFRTILDDKAVDAVIVATPDHWHAPATIMACDAGKHVYVEKPCSHNIREGRLMVEAARRTGRVVTVGTQSRSTTTLKTGIELLHKGEIGKVLVAKAWNSQKRRNIGHKKPGDPPKGFDYSMWTGPAPRTPFRENCHHYTWHWWYSFGTGDAGNDGVHELDLAVWGLGLTTHPSRVTGYATKMFFDDDQQFPDTQYITYEYPGNGTIGEKRMLFYEHHIWSPYGLQGFDSGNAFYGTKGYMILTKRSGWKIFDSRDRVVKEQKGGCSVPQHISNFIDCVHTGRRPNADIETGHRSAALSHLANILGKTGRSGIHFDPEKEAIVDAHDINSLTGREYQEGHWAVPKGG